MFQISHHPSLASVKHQGLLLRSRWIGKSVCGSWISQALRQPGLWFPTAITAHLCQFPPFLSARLVSMSLETVVKWITEAVEVWHSLFWCVSFHKVLWFSGVSGFWSRAILGNLDRSNVGMSWSLLRFDWEADPQRRGGILSPCLERWTRSRGIAGLRLDGRNWPEERC